MKMNMLWYNIRYNLQNPYECIIIVNTRNYLHQLQNLIRNTMGGSRHDIVDNLERHLANNHWTYKLRVQLFD